MARAIHVFEVRDWKKVSRIIIAGSLGEKDKAPTARRSKPFATLDLSALKPILQQCFRVGQQGHWL